MSPAAEPRPGQSRRAWAVVVPVKRSDLAKTRLRGDFVDLRSELALAFAEDVVTVAASCRPVAGVVAVTNDSSAAARLRSHGAVVVPDRPEAGLNAALHLGARHVQDRLPGAWLAALQSDLPALTAEVLERALRRAAASPSAYVTDAAGTGTTLYATTTSPFAPRFGPASAAAHRDAGAHEVDGKGLERLRRDVDTDEDLRAALALGVGECTAAVLRRAGEPGLPEPGQRSGPRHRLS